MQQRGSFLGWDVERRIRIAQMEARVVFYAARKAISEAKMLLARGAPCRKV
jgi:hypothetical protein